MPVKKPTAAQRKQAEEAALMAALAWPGQPCPEPYPAEKVRELAQRSPSDRPVRAWTYNAYAMRVTYGCFTVYGHSFQGSKTTTQTPGGPWFDTGAEALLAMRWAVCREMAAKLLSLANRPDPRDE